MNIKIICIDHKFGIAENSIIVVPVVYYNVYLAIKEWLYFRLLNTTERLFLLDNLEISDIYSYLSELLLVARSN